jgi:gamma-glutamylcyclotransferase (GGCT)/AIG2-like uncharacterized protein YtfP
MLLFNFFARNQASKQTKAQHPEAGPQALGLGADGTDVFVYGTLRQGFANHHFLADATFRGPGRTAEAHGLYLEAGIPFLAAGEGRYPVVGELYTVNAATLAALDTLEEHPHVYERRPAPVLMDDGHAVTAWIYCARAPQGRPLPTGDFADVNRL